MAHPYPHFDADAFDARAWLTYARERGLLVAREDGHVTVGLGSASWRDWVAFATLAEDNERAILEVLKQTQG
jgi:hypothetical protein